MANKTHSTRSQNQNKPLHRRARLANRKHTRAEIRASAFVVVEMQLEENRSRFSSWDIWEIWLIKITSFSFSDTSPPHTPYKSGFFFICEFTTKIGSKRKHRTPVMVVVVYFGCNFSAEWCLFSVRYSFFVVCVLSFATYAYKLLFATTHPAAVVTVYHEVHHDKSTILQTIYFSMYMLMLNGIQLLLWNFVSVYRIVLIPFFLLWRCTQCKLAHQKQEKKKKTQKLKRMKKTNGKTSNETDDDKKKEAARQTGIQC